MLQQYAVVLAFIGVAFGFMAGPLIIQWFVAPRKPSPEKLTTYECGEEAVGTPWIKFNIRFYVFALIFLIFDVELIFVLPWATVYRDMAHESQIQVDRESVLTPDPALIDPGKPEGAAPAPRLARKLGPGESWALVWLPWFEGVVFVLILVVGLAYVWAKGDLEWSRPQILTPAASTAPAAPPETRHVANA